MEEDAIISDEMLEAMGIGHEVLEAVTDIVGRRPRMGELSTLIAMWDANGRQQSLLGWLRGQRHSEAHHDYVYSGDDEVHREVREPRVRDCIEIARSMSHVGMPAEASNVQRGQLLYMAGRLSDAFLGSDYARRYLHIAEHPVELDQDEEQTQYLTMILQALKSHGVVGDIRPVERGGLYGTLVRFCGGAEPSPCGFDILSCREVRLDSFLFGEEAGRYVLAVEEEMDDQYLLKMDEAGLNCCFLGRATKGRVLVDGMDFGEVNDFCHKKEKVAAD